MVSMILSFNASASHSLLQNHITALMMVVIANAQVEIFSMVRSSRITVLLKLLLSRKCLTMVNTWSLATYMADWLVNQRALLVMSFSKIWAKMAAIVMILVLLISHTFNLRSNGGP